MYPTLHDGDCLLVKKTEHSAVRGTIVLLKLSSNQSPRSIAVKRIVAIGGDIVKIDYETNAVYVNGLILFEPYINYDQEDPMRQNGEPCTRTFVIPDGRVFLLGDNRNYSLDSRDEEMGLVSEKDIIGAVSIFLRLE